MNEWKERLIDVREEIILQRFNRISRTGPMRSRPFITSLPVIIFVERGHYTYRVEEEAFSLEPGDILFCPPGSRRIMELTDPGHPMADFRLHLRVSPGLLVDSPLEETRKISGCQKVLPLLRQLASLVASERRDCAVLQRSLVTSLILTALFDPDNPGTGRFRRLDYREKRVVETLIQDDPSHPELIRRMAEKTGLTRDYFSRVFHETYGLSPKGYITAQRLEKAAALLRETDLPVYGIGEECGYENVSLFNRLFKKRFGRTPTSYRKSGA